MTRSEWAHSLRQRVRDSAIDVTIARCSTTPPDMKSWKVHAGYNSSDHFPITFSLQMPTVVPGKTVEPQLVVSKEALRSGRDQEAFSICVEDSLVDQTELESMSLDEAAEYLAETLLNVGIEEGIIIKKNEGYKPATPWLE